MPTLTIKDFSCIKHAKFTVKPVNVIIGAQGSGKSVTIKLFYFFSELLRGHVEYAEKGLSLDAYKTEVSRTFCSWFPPSTWGNKDFTLEYTAGEFTVKFSTGRGLAAINNPIFSVSNRFEKFYKSSREFLRKIADDLNSSEGKSLFDNFDLLYDAKTAVEERLKIVFKTEYIESQIFIPAGRTFFTNIGSLVTSLHQNYTLDQLIINFARFFNVLKQQNVRVPLNENSFNIEYYDKRNNLISSLFNGEIKFEKEREFVNITDGREIPFSILSSGQQELLPIVMIVDYLNLKPNPLMRSLNKSSRLLYIEEPETHLFPSAQSDLMEFLISSTTPFENTNLIITTHSPYIMSKLNVFLKAGEIAKDESKRDAVRQIVPEECWLTTEQLGAYCIEDGVMQNIVNAEDGLVDSTYLDQISEDLSKDFEELLNIEFETE